MSEQEAPAQETSAQDTSEPISLETAASWLAAARPASVLALLRDPEFALLGMSAFVGFRVNAASYANPLVRSRLAQEIVKNVAFAEKLRLLADQFSPSGATPEGERGQPEGGKAQPAASPPASRDEALKAERDRRRRERDEARDALRRAEQGLAETEAARAQADAARAEQARLAQQQQQRIGRLERQVAQLQAENKALLKNLRLDKISPPRRVSPSLAPSEMGGGKAEPGADHPWQEAVRHLLHKGKYEAAFGLAQDVLRTHPENLAALDIAAEASERKGQGADAAAWVRRRLAVHLARGHVASASDALARLVTLTPTFSEVLPDVRVWLPFLRSAEAIAAARPAVERLRAQSPRAHAWLEIQVRTLAPALVDELMPPPGALGPDDPLPLPGDWTARRLVQAVNANAEAAVAAARAALTALEADVAARVWDALTRAAESDDSALAPLRRAPRGPVVVDGSNAAWFDQHSYAAPRARLRPILELRRALRRRGYFPVVLCADAPLPFTVDDPETLRAMLGLSEISLVDSGVDADEVLLREAKRYQSPLVTNDYMVDWDPQNEVEKIQYTISLTGEVHLLA